MTDLNDTEKPAITSNGMLPAVFLQEGAFVNFPKIIQEGDWDLICPCCGYTWHKEGRGYGFVKSSAQAHIANCYDELLKQNGLMMKQPYCMDNLGWELVKI